MRTNRFPLLAVALALVLAGSVSAQTNAPAPRRDGGGGFGGRFAQGGEGPVMAVLTDDQRNSFRQAMEPQRKQIRDLENNLAEARKELTGASATSPFNESLVRSKAAAVASAETEMAVLRARAFSQIKPPLTSDQIERMRNLSGDTEQQFRPKAASAAAATTTDNSSIRPKERVQQRDENDLPVTGK